MLQARVLRSYDELTPLIPAWRELVLCTGGASIFQTPEWAIGWWRAMQANSTLFCVALFDEERPVGFAPYCIESRWGIRVVRAMGGDVNDSDGMLSGASHALFLERAVFDALEDDQSRWDAAYVRPPALTGQTETTTTTSYSLSSDWIVMLTSPTPLPKIQLPGSWDLYWKGLSHERRRVWSRHRRRLDDQGGLTFRLYTDPEQVSRELPIFLQARNEHWRKRNRWRKMIAFQRSPRFGETLTGISVELAARGHVWLGKLCIGEKAIAWELLFRMKDTLWSYLTTYAREHAPYSPGIWVALEVVRCAIASGITRIECGRGDQLHKFSLGSQAAFGRNLLIVQRNSRGKTVIAAEWLRERVTDLYRSLQ